MIFRQHPRLGTNLTRLQHLRGREQRVRPVCDRTRSQHKSEVGTFQDRFLKCSELAHGVLLAHRRCACKIRALCTTLHTRSEGETMVIKLGQYAKISFFVPEVQHPRGGTKTRLLLWRPRNLGLDSATGQVLVFPRLRPPRPTPSHHMRHAGARGWPIRRPRGMSQALGWQGKMVSIFFRYIIVAPRCHISTIHAVPIGVADASHCPTTICTLTPRPSRW